MRELRFQLSRADIGPDDCARFSHREGTGLEAFAKARLRHGRRLQHRTRCRELPAVEQAPDAIALHPPQAQRRGAVRTLLVQQANLAASVPEGHVTLTEDLDLDGVAAANR